MPFLAQEHFPLSNKDIVSWTFDHIKYDWDKPIYIDALDDKRFISARKARKLVRQLAAGFKAIGVQKGDCVSIHSLNDIYYPIFFLGVIAAGGVYAGTNPAYTPHELTHTTKSAKAKYILTQPELLPNILKAAEDTGISKKNVIIFNPKGEKAPEGYLQWADLLKHGETDWVRFDDYETAYQTGAARLYSSGTTGLPKAAELSHLNLTAQHTLVYETNPRPYEVRRFLALPMFHAATAPSAFCTPLRNGDQAFVAPRYDLEKWFWAHEKYKITDLGVVPPIAVQVINSPMAKKYSLKSVKVGQCGAAPLDKGPQARLQVLIEDGAPLTQVWGMTETSCIATRHKYPAGDETGSVGTPIPNLDVKLVDDDGKDITGYDVRGELCVRGPTVIKGYFENPEANARDWDKDNFFHTGDIAYIDGKTGLYYIVDRKKELIKVRGFQVAPPELEGVLLMHPEIVDAAVIGVPDPVREGDELPRAYITRRTKDGKPSEEEVKEYIKEKLIYYKKLEGGVVFVDAIAKNASGKILKRLLREQAKEEMAREKRGQGARL
ncbi:putative AMP-dependent synthetase/ligase, AMP-binding enzyme domain, ANL domain-containing protein [Septoria linicola]|nr:putative AMP-dependent synthetase/ligase, AMP-binding enzyme domain, ANL domain-containing protein [Septoria linicola]